jgi:hypothetical protein
MGQSKGSCATHTVVGASLGSEKANEDAPVQTNVVEYLSLSQFGGPNKEMAN